MGSGEISPKGTNVFERVSAKAKLIADGHFTLLAFTTNYKAAFGTPACEPFELHLLLAYLPDFPSADLALEWLSLQDESVSFDAIHDLYINSPDTFREDVWRNINSKLGVHITPGANRSGVK